MVQQLIFQLPEIDREATRKRVEQALETARIYKQIGTVRREVKTTPSYTPHYHGPTNEVGKPTEEVASWNVDTEKRIRETVEAVEKAVSRLGRLEREIIQRRYLGEEEEYDFIVCQELHLSERKYRRVKARAIYKLAFMLRLEVMIDPEDPKPAA